MSRLRKVLRIARWEVSKGAGTVDRRTAAIGLVGVVLAAAIVPALATGGVALDRGIYRVGVEEGDVYYGPARADPTFAVREPSRAAFEAGGLELLVGDDRIYVQDSPKGRAALAAFRETVGRYNDRQMRTEPNQSAAFPVVVSLRYVEREGVEVVAPAPGGDGGAGGGAGADGGAGDGGTGTDGGTPEATSTPSGGGLGAPGFGGVFGAQQDGSPSDIAPPFPFQSLVLAFAFVLPLNFIIQAYGSSMLGERINRRGELLLVAPVSRHAIVAGKTLPYFAVALGLATAIALAIGGGVLSVVAVAPLALLFLAATFVGSMFARSFKELTFVTTAVSVLLTTYAFVPAIFTDVGPVALISPLTLVVRDLTGEAVAPVGVAFATLPTTLTAGVLFLFGAGIYREEDLFTQRPLHLKALDALASRIARARSLVLVTALLVPFVFVAELLAVATLFALPVAVSIPLVLCCVAVVEELAKGVPVLAGFEHARYPATARGALAAGAASGLGFFLGEKLTLVVQLVGLPQLRVGRAAFADAAGLSGPLVALFLVAPLVLHVVTAAVSGLGATRSDRRWWVATLGVAVLVHLAYNLAVVRLLA
ncbi:MAG: PrsW family intramembrane metalloprotease [Haloarculaceae archaeon]